MNDKDKDALNKVIAEMERRIPGLLHPQYGDPSPQAAGALRAMARWIREEMLGEPLEPRP